MMPAEIFATRQLHGHLVAGRKLRLGVLACLSVRLSVIVLSKLARAAHLLGVLTGPAFAPIKRLSAGAGICVSIPIIVVGFFVRPGLDPNRIRYVVAAVQMQKISKALERYKADCGDYPPLSKGLHALAFNPGAKCWNGPHLRDIPMDPWHRPYIYSRSPGVTLPEILSLGADEKQGGELFDADFSSLRVQASHLRETPVERRNRWFLLSIWIGAWTCLIGCAVALIRMSRSDCSA
jgi:type II secretion system protein G